MKYERLYKCELCGEVYPIETVEMVGKSMSNVIALAEKRLNGQWTQNGKYPIKIHGCNGDSGSVGVSNFIGIKFLPK